MKVLLASLLLLLAIPTFAKPPKHALIKVLEAPLAAPKVAFTGLKGTLYGLMFTTEVGVDAVHATFVVADRVFDTVALKGVPVFDTVYAVTSTVAVDSGKLDTWLERQQDGLFGSHN